MALNASVCCRMRVGIGLVTVKDLFVDAETAAMRAGADFCSTVAECFRHTLLVLSRSKFLTSPSSESTANARYKGPQVFEHWALEH